MKFKDLLVSEFAPFGTLQEYQLEALERHHGLLTQWNRRMNLTRIEKLEDAVRLHYCESLLLGQALPVENLCVADIGSGAGFPGFPVAVLRPEYKMDLVESHQRKAVFLREASGGLNNIRVVSARAESLEGSYDWIISRAVLPAEVLSLGLAPRAAILMAATDLNELSSRAFEVKQLPWGSGRVLALFHVKPRVPA